MKLTIELLPKTATVYNLRSKITPHKWQKIKAKLYNDYHHKCSICGEKRALIPGHEIWEWNEKTSVQKLIDLIVICRICHQTMHFDIAEIMRRETEAREHFMKINNCSAEEFQSELEKAREIYERRSKQEWVLDVSWTDEKEWVRDILYPVEEVLVD